MDNAGRLYEAIGHNYGSARQPDRRIAEQITAAIGAGQSVVNVGAGTGNYEPPDRAVVAVEPSSVMLEQRQNQNATVRAIAERLPFPDDAFDVATAILTIHHWTDRAGGIQELGRVARRQVSWVYDTEVTSRMWLIEYFPELATAPWEVGAPGAASIGEHLEVDEVRVLWVPPDCIDGFSGAFWNRPERYLDPAVQAGMSTLARLEPSALTAGSERLRTAIDSGEWDRRHGHLRNEDRFDMGYRLVLSHRR